VVIIPMNMHKSEAVQKMSIELYEQLQKLGVDVLLDDRNERAGVMFADHDLIGIPHRIIIGDKGLKNSIIEYKNSLDIDKTEININEIQNFLNKTFA